MLGSPSPRDHRLKYLLQLAAEKYRDDRPRRLVGAKPVVLADVSDRGSQQTLVGAHQPLLGITAAQKKRKWTLSAGVSPGSSRLVPVSVPIDQLLCLPEPLTPAKGFSCRRQTRP